MLKICYGKRIVLFAVSSENYALAFMFRYTLQYVLKHYYNFFSKKNADFLLSVYV